MMPLPGGGTTLDELPGPRAHPLPGNPDTDTLLGLRQIEYLWVAPSRMAEMLGFSRDGPKRIGT